MAKEQGLPPLPDSSEAEMSVIAAFTWGGTDYIDEVLGILDERDFHDTYCRAVFRAIRWLWVENRTTPDYVTIADRLKITGDLDRIGGLKRLRDASSGVYSQYQVVHHARIVKEKAQGRRLWEIGLRLMSDCGRGEIVAVMASNAVSAITDVSANRDVEIVNLAEFVELADKPPVGVKTGFPKIDEQIVVVDNGSLLTIGADTGGGKTSFLLDFARHSLRRGERGLFISTEMTKEQMIHRVAAAEAMVPLNNIRQGSLSHGQRDALARAVAKVPLPFARMADAQLRKIVSAITTAFRDGLNWVIVDYLQDVKDDSRRHETKNDMLETIMIELKEVALKFNIPVLAGSQFTKPRPNEQKSVASLRGSSYIGQKSDMVFILEPQASGQCKLRIAKGRQVGRFEIDMEYFHTFTTFSPGNGQKQEEIGGL